MGRMQLYENTGKKLGKLHKEYRIKSLIVEKTTIKENFLTSLKWSFNYACFESLCDQTSNKSFIHFHIFI